MPHIAARSAAPVLDGMHLPEGWALFLTPQDPFATLLHFAMIKSGMLLHFTYRIAWTREQVAASCALRLVCVCLCCTYLIDAIGVSGGMNWQIQDGLT